MAQPHVKDGAITYYEFDKVYSVLSRKEQYEVVEILYKNGINLVDEHISDDTVVLDVDIPDGLDTNDPLDEDEEFDVNDNSSLFKDPGYNSNKIEDLVINKNIKQSNEILCHLIQEGSRQAAQDLCVKNERLVDKCVYAYEKRFRNQLDSDDLKQVGFLGLIKAAQKFSIHQGTAFSTYAMYWIKQSISREIMDNGYAIRIPVHMMERINKVAAIDNRLSIEHVDLQSRIHMIALELDLTEEDIIECLVLRKNYLAYASLDVPIGEDEESLLGDFIPTDEEDSVESIVFGHELHNTLAETLSTLTARERTILELRFGWNDAKPHTLEEVGKEFNVTRERIRQIEAKALRKMKHPSRSGKLKPFWEE